MEKSFQQYLHKHGLTQFDLQAVLFDMDGVLYNSMPAHEKSWQQVASDWGLQSEPNEFFLHEGRTGKSTINLLFNRTFNRNATDEEVLQIYEKKSEYFSQYNNNQTIEGATELLNLVRSQGLKPVLVTGSGQKKLSERLNKTFPNIFTQATMVTAFDVKYGKPHPEPFLMGLKKGGNLSPNQALVIENAPMGVEAAYQAGIFTIAVNTGPLSDKILMDAGADLVFPSMHALLDKWNEILVIAGKH